MAFVRFIVIGCYYSNPTPDMKQLTVQHTLEDFLTTSPLAFRVLEQHGLSIKRFDNLDLSLDAACMLTDTRVEKVLEDLLAIGEPVRMNERGAEALSTEEILRLLHQNHHEFLARLFPRIELLLYHLAKHPQDDQINLQALTEAFLQLKADFAQHVMEETESLFPYVELLLRIERGEGRPDAILALMEQGLAGSMVENDCDIHQFVLRLRLSSNHYEPADTNNIMLNSLCRALKELEESLYQHEYIEFEILLKRILELENNAMERVRREG